MLELEVQEMGVAADNLKCSLGIFEKRRKDDFAIFCCTKQSHVNSFILLSQ